MGIIFKQQTAVSEVTSGNTVFCRKNFRLNSRTFRGVFTEVLLRGDGLVTGLVKKCLELKVFLCYVILQVKDSFD